MNSRSKIVASAICLTLSAGALTACWHEASGSDQAENTVESSTPTAPQDSVLLPDAHLGPVESHSGDSINSLKQQALAQQEPAPEVAISPVASALIDELETIIKELHQERSMATKLNKLIKFEKSSNLNERELIKAKRQTDHAARDLFKTVEARLAMEIKKLRY